MSRYRVLSDEQWERIVPLLRAQQGRMGRPMADHRMVVEAIAYRYRTGIPWRDLPREVFGPWQTVWKRHARWVKACSWDRVLTQLQAQADAAEQVDWRVSVDSTINRAHQHATNTTRPEQDRGGRIDYRNRDPTGVNLLVTASDAPVAGCPARSTTPWTGVGDRWRWLSLRGSVTMGSG